MPIPLTDLIQFGELAGVLIVVGIFMAYIKTRDKQMSDMHKRCEDKLEAITDKCINAFDEHAKS